VALTARGFGAVKPTALSKALLAEGDVAEVLKKPSREELARRAMRMFSSVRKLPEGEVGDRERDVSVDVRLRVVMRGGTREPSEVCGLLANALEPGMAPMPIVGISLTMGEYCEIGEEPLKAPGGGALREGGAAAREV
jgi:hypothetical protein